MPLWIWDALSQLPETNVGGLCSLIALHHQILPLRGDLRDQLKLDELQVAQLNYVMMIASYFVRDLYRRQGDVAMMIGDHLRPWTQAASRYQLRYVSLFCFQ